MPFSGSPLVLSCTGVLVGMGNIHFKIGFSPVILVEVVEKGWTFVESCWLGIGREYKDFIWYFDGTSWEGYFWVFENVDKYHV